MALQGVHPSPQYLSPGTVLRLTGGRIYRGSYVASSNCTIITDGPGTGPAAVISGAVLVTNPWSPAAHGVSSTSVPLGHCMQSHAMQLFVNHKRTTMARHPNGDGSIRIIKDSIAGAKHVLHVDPKVTSADWVGATVHVRTTRFTYEIARVVAVSLGTIQLHAPLRFGAKVGYGLYLSGLSSFLDAPSEWWYNASSSMLHLVPPVGVHVSTAFVEVACLAHGVIVEPGASGVKIHGVRFEGQVEDAVLVPGTAENTEVQDCQFEGQGQHGVHLVGKDRRTHIVRNTFAYIMGRGIHANQSRDLEVSNNALFHIGEAPGQGVSGVNGLSAVVVHSDVVGAVIRRNVVAFVGYIGIRTAATQVLAEQNVVLHTCLVLDDCAALYAGWGPTSVDITVRRNFIMHAIGNRRHTPHVHHTALSNGIYLDDWSNRIAVSDNFVAFVSGTGINIHNSHSNHILRNVVYASGNAQLAFDEGDDIVGPQNIKRNVVMHNIFVSVNAQSNCLQETSKFTRPPVFDFYGAPNHTRGNTFHCLPDNTAVQQKLKGRYVKQTSFSHYQSISGNFAESHVLCTDSPHLCSSKQSPIIVLSNPTPSTVEYNLSPLNQYAFLRNGSALLTSIVVAPLSAELIVVTKQQHSVECTAACHQRGRCLEVSDVCDCEAGYAGQACELIIDPRFHVPVPSPATDMTGAAAGAVGAPVPELAGHTHADHRQEPAELLQGRPTGPSDPAAGNASAGEGALHSLAFLLAAPCCMVLIMARVVLRMLCRPLPVGHRPRRAL